MSTPKLKEALQDALVTLKQGTMKAIQSQLILLL